DLAGAVLAGRRVGRAAGEDLPAARRVAGPLAVVRSTDLDLFDPGFGARTPSERDVRHRQLRRPEPLGHSSLPGERDADDPRSRPNRDADLHLALGAPGL